jgi:hypothetical protein
MIILPAHCNNEHNSEGANIAVVHVNLKEALKRSALMTQLKKKDRSLAKMAYWSDQVLFYHLADIQILQLKELADKVVEDQFFFRKPDDVMEPYGDPARTDCDQMVVWDRGLVSWSAYDHYCSDHMETDQIHIEVMQELMKPKKGK